MAEPGHGPETIVEPRVRREPALEDKCRFVDGSAHGIKRFVDLEVPGDDMPKLLVEQKNDAPAGVVFGVQCVDLLHAKQNEAKGTAAKSNLGRKMRCTAERGPTRRAEGSHGASNYSPQPPPAPPLPEPRRPKTPTISMSATTTMIMSIQDPMMSLL